MKRYPKGIRPNRIRDRGKTRFLYYDHAQCGRDALTPLSRFFSRGIRQYLRDPVVLPGSGVVRRVADELTQNGIATFSIEQLEEGPRLFDELQQDMRNATDRNQMAIDVWKKTIDGPSEDTKPYQFVMDVDPSVANPGWQLVIHPQILSIVNYYMHAYSKVQYMNYWINTLQSERSHTASQLWHRDPDGTTIKLFVYLNDVNERSGPFFYARGTHLEELRRTNTGKKRLDDEGLARVFGRDLEIESVVGKAGTIFIANTCGVHKGGFVAEGERHVFVAGYNCPWIDRSDVGLALPEDPTPELTPAQLAAICWPASGVGV